MSALKLPPQVPDFLSGYLPVTRARRFPFVTLTYATSLDSHLSLRPGVQTALSGPETKALTHHLRLHHDAILIGASTAVADDPGLNSRLPSATLEAQPQPVVLDPQFRWMLTADARAIATARSGRGKAPIVLVSEERYDRDDPRVKVLEEVGGRVETLPGLRWAWAEILKTLGRLGLRSVMVEGGGTVINHLLMQENLKFVDSVVITVAPVYLGRGGVNVSPERAQEKEAAVRFPNVRWCTLGSDVVMASSFAKERGEGLEAAP